MVDRQKEEAGYSPCGLGLLPPRHGIHGWRPPLPPPPGQAKPPPLSGRLLQPKEPKVGEP